MTAPLAAPPAAATEASLSRQDVLVLRSRFEADRQATLRIWAIVAACAVAVLGIAVLLDRFVEPRSTAMPSAVGRMTLPTSVAESAVIYDTGVLPLAPEEATAINAERPIDVAAVIPAKALRIAAESANGVGFAAALRCLTQAVYYEAASEPDEGQRGVAQVVLNRVRHPAFPNTVCGVVYQGSQRVTGCQFSFTCDGSLARVPSISGWARAERVARDALAGRVAAAVGNATHYHANYVVPYWAPTLDKAATIGAHIFYLMRGFLGSPRAFTGRYDVALEAPPVVPEIISEDIEGLTPGLADGLVITDSLTPGIGAPAEDARSGRLIPGEGEPALQFDPPAALRADEQRGTIKAKPPGRLKVDDGKISDAAPSDAGDAD